MKEGRPDISNSEIKKKVLSFEEFSHRDANGMHQYNNFFVYFTNNWFAEMNKKEAAYQKLLAEHRDMVMALTEKLEHQNVGKAGTAQALQPLEKDLYQAYTMMRQYGGFAVAERIFLVFFLQWRNPCVRV